MTGPITPRGMSKGGRPGGGGVCECPGPGGGLSIFRRAGEGGACQRITLKAAACVGPN